MSDEGDASGEGQVIDDLAEHANLFRLARWARSNGLEVPIDTVREISYGHATATSIHRYGEYWTKALISLATRARVARLERDGAGAVVLRFIEPLPDDEQLERAWDRAYWADGSGAA